MKKDYNEIDYQIDYDLFSVEEIVKTLGGEVVETDKMGRKKLAFEVAGFTDGFMVNQVVKMPADKIVELKRQLKLNDSVIRIMFTVKECA